MRSNQVLWVLLVLSLLGGGCRKKPSQSQRGTRRDTGAFLLLMAERGNVQSVRTLLADGTDVNARGEFGSTPLHEAGSGESAEMVQLLIDHGADVNARDDYGFTPLHAAAGRGNREMAKSLVAGGADVNAKTLTTRRWHRERNGSTPLHIAARCGHYELAQWLVDNGADVHARDDDGHTPLHVAVGRGSPEHVRLLVGKGANINARSHEGDTPLLIAVGQCHGDVAQVLVEAGADIREKDQRGRTLLHVAVQALEPGYSAGAVGPLIAGGIDVNATVELGHSALHYAARDGLTRAAELLVAAGADVNARTAAGQTPLHFAVRRGYYDIAALLVDAGADRDLATKQGQTALDYALEFDREDLVNLLQQGSSRAAAEAQAAETPTDSRMESQPEDNDSLTDLQRLVRGNTAFALDLYAKLCGSEGNLFFSPYSISTALAMTYAGAREDTAAEMAKTLHFSLDPERLHPAFAELQAGLNKVQEAGNVRLSLANTLWPQQGHPFLQEYLSLIQLHYGVSITAVDYSTETTREAARQTINKWVESRTQDRIKELVRPEHLDDATRLVLTNAIYFNGKWKNEFDPQNTRDEAFYLSAAKSVPVAMMHQTERFRYAEDASLQILELPYRGGELSMLILLPARIEGLGQLEKGLSAEKLRRWRSLLREREVIVSLPKFKVTWDAELKKVLQGMGMVKAFEWPGANFAGLNGNPHWFYVGKVVHKAYVDVNEEGTEAAAATAVVMNLGGIPAQPPEFRADHPFLFLIQDNRTGGILFLGRVVDPTKSAQ